LDGAALDLPEGSLAQLLAELEGLAGRLDLVLDPLGAWVDPGDITPGPVPRGRAI
jgi:hypothetical protein